MQLDIDNYLPSKCKLSKILEKVIQKFATNFFQKGDACQRRSRRFAGNRSRHQRQREGGEPVGNDERDQLHHQGQSKLTSRRFVALQSL